MQRAKAKMQNDSTKANKNTKREHAQKSIQKFLLLVCHFDS